MRCWISGVGVGNMDDDTSWQIISSSRKWKLYHFQIIDFICMANSWLTKHNCSIHSICCIQTNKLSYLLIWWASSHNMLKQPKGFHNMLKYTLANCIYLNHLVWTQQAWLTKPSLLDWITKRCVVRGLLFLSLHQECQTRSPRPKCVMHTHLCFREGEKSRERSHDGVTTRVWHHCIK